MSLLVGAGVAAGVGLAGNMWAERQRRKADQARIREIRAAEQNAMATQRAALDQIGSMYNPLVAQGDRYSDMYAEGVDSGRWDVQPRDFGYDRTVDDFLDPAAAYEQEQARRQMEASLAGSGRLMSGAGQTALMQQASDLSRRQYGVAHDRMTHDRTQSYREFIDKFNAQREAAAQQQQQIMNMINRGDNARGTMANQISQFAGLEAQGIRNIGQADGMMRALPGYSRAAFGDAIGQIGTQAAPMLAGAGMEARSINAGQARTPLSVTPLRGSTAAGMEYYNSQGGMEHYNSRGDMLRNLRYNPSQLRVGGNL